jgi:SAM-dependent methyltransferase
MGSDDQKDPYINWQELWNKYKIEENASFKMPEGKIALNLGSGHSRLKDLMFTDDLLNHKEIRVDLDESCNPDIISNIEDLPQIKNESVDLVYSSHSLEHIYFHKVPQCLSEWHRVIKKGGEVRIIVPNLKIPAQLVVEGKILEKMYDSPSGSVSAIDMFYGHRNHVRQNEFMAHKTGFTKESAEQILHELGYNRSSVTEHDRNLLIRIFK